MEYAKKIERAIMLGLLITSPALFADGTRAWLFDISYNIAGIEQTFPTTRQVHCQTEDLPLPDIANPGQQCGMRMHGHFGNTVTWQIDCSSEWEIVQGVGRISVADGHATGDVHVQILSPASAPQFMVFHIAGVAEGSCDMVDRAPGIVSSLMRH